MYSDSRRITQDYGMDGRRTAHRWALASGYTWMLAVALSHYAWRHADEQTWPMH